MQRAHSDPAPPASQQSLLGHTAENTPQRRLGAFVEVIRDPAAPSRVCELWPSTSQLGLRWTPHGTTQSLCAMIHRPYCPGFPLSVICQAPIVSDNEREPTACEQEQIQEPEHKRRITDLSPESLWHREKVYPALCSIALSEVPTCYCRHR